MVDYENEGVLPPPPALTQPAAVAENMAYYCGMHLAHLFKNAPIAHRYQKECTEQLQTAQNCFLKHDKEKALKALQNAMAAFAHIPSEIEYDKAVSFVRARLLRELDNLSPYIDSYDIQALKARTLWKIDSLVLDEQSFTLDNLRFSDLQKNDFSGYMAEEHTHFFRENDITLYKNNKPFAILKKTSDQKVQVIIQPGFTLNELEQFHLFLEQKKYTIKNFADSTLVNIQKKIEKIEKNIRQIEVERSSDYNPAAEMHIKELSQEKTKLKILTRLLQNQNEKFIHGTIQTRLDENRVYDILEEKPGITGTYEKAKKSVQSLYETEKSLDDTVEDPILQSHVSVEDIFSDAALFAEIQEMQQKQYILNQQKSAQNNPATFAQIQTLKNHAEYLRARLSHLAEEYPIQEAYISISFEKSTNFSPRKLAQKGLFEKDGFIYTQEGRRAFSIQREENKIFIHSTEDCNATFKDLLRIKSVLKDIPHDFYGVDPTPALRSRLTTYMRLKQDLEKTIDLDVLKDMLPSVPTALFEDGLRQLSGMFAHLQKSDKFIEKYSIEYTPKITLPEAYVVQSTQITNPRTVQYNLENRLINNGLKIVPQEGSVLDRIRNFLRLTNEKKYNVYYKDKKIAGMRIDKNLARLEVFAGNLDFATFDQILTLQTLIPHQQNNLDALLSSHARKLIKDVEFAVHELEFQKMYADNNPAYYKQKMQNIVDRLEALHKHIEFTREYARHIPLQDACACVLSGMAKAGTLTAQRQPVLLHPSTTKADPENIVPISPNLDASAHQRLPR